MGDNKQRPTTASMRNGRMGETYGAVKVDDFASVPAGGIEVVERLGVLILPGAPTGEASGQEEG